MSGKEFFNAEMKQKFESIGSKLYNLKYSLELFINYLECESDISLNLVCLALILNNYFSIVKDEYNSLEESLGLLL